MAMGRAGGNQVMDYQQSLLLAAVSLSATVLVAVFAVACSAWCRFWPE